MKQYIKALDKDGDCFSYICSTFPGLSNEKQKARVFDGPQIITLMKNNNFETSMVDIEASAWQLFVQVVKM